MKILNISAVLLFISCSVTMATPSLSEIAKERSDLEVLSQEINTLQKKKNQEIDFLLEKKTELLTEFESLKTTNQELQKNLGKISSKIPKDKAKVDLSKWNTFLDEYIKEIEAEIALQITPSNSKIKTLKNIKDNLNNPKESFENTLSLLIVFIEKELKESKQIEYSIADLKINQKLQSAEIVRFGRVLYYFKTSDNQTGFIYLQNKNWTTEIITDPNVTAPILKTMEAVKNQRKYGYFENLVLPKSYFQ